MKQTAHGGGGGDVGGRGGDDDDYDDDNFNGYTCRYYLLKKMKEDWLLPHFCLIHSCCRNDGDYIHYTTSAADAKELINQQEISKYLSLMKTVQQV